ncbi:hypothetical protein P7250_23025 [Vibrio parahaemolyticus]|nr:hypothetical protein [Vibrio parahaemolyticus]
MGSQQTKLLTASDWADVQSQLECFLANVSFKYKDHKISVVREYQTESSSKLVVYIDDQIKGAWIDLNLALLRNSDEKPNLLKLSDCYTIY